MESMFEDEQGLEQEAVGSRRTMTSTCRGTNEEDCRGLSYETLRESDSDLLDNLQPSSLEMLTNEIINTGTQANVSPYHKPLSQGSHDVSPSNDNTQGICDATLPGKLQSSDAVVETATEERHLEEENETHFKAFEPSSDDTDEWETASEESVELDPEPHDSQRVREATGSYCQDKHNEDAGPHGQETVNEDVRLHHHKTVSEDAGPHGGETVSEDAGPHGGETVSEDAGPHGGETVSEDAGPHGGETVSEDAGPHGGETVSEDAGPHGGETVSEDAGPHGGETVSEDAGPHGGETVSEDAGPHGGETVSEDAGPHGGETVSEDAGPHGGETVSEDAGPHGGETVSEDAGPHGGETVSEDAGPHGGETVSEDAGPHGGETVSEDAGPHGGETVSEDAGPHGGETVSEDAGPHGGETVSEDAGPHGGETVSEDAGPHGGETVSEDAGPHGGETVSEDAGPHGRDSVSEDAGALGRDSVSEDAGALGRDSVSEDAGALGRETVNKEARNYGSGTISEEAGPHGQETFSEEAEPQEALCENTGPYGQETFGEEAGPHSQKTVNDEDELHGLEPVSEETVPFGLELYSEKAEPLCHEDTKTDNKVATLHSQDTSDDDIKSYGQKTVNDEAEPHRHEMVIEETEFCDKKKTGPLVQETVSDLTRYHDEEAVSELIRPLEFNTVSDMTHGSNANPELQDSETVSGMKSEEFDEDCKISLQKDNISAVPDQTLNDIIVTVNEDTERPGENKISNSVEILESIGDGINSDSTYEGVGKGTFSDGTRGGYFETVCQATRNACREGDPDEIQDVYIETVHEEVPNVCKEVFHMEGDIEDKQDIYKAIDSHKMHFFSKEKVGENILQETFDSEDTEVRDLNASMVQLSERMKEDLSDKRIIIEPSSEEREMAKKQSRMKSNEHCEHNDEFSEHLRVIDVCTTNDDDLDNNNDDDSKQGWNLAETSSTHVLTEDIEIAYLECERLEQKRHSIKTLVRTGEELPKVFPNILNQETVLELQYSTQDTIDEKSEMDCTIDIDTPMDVSGPPLIEEKGQVDYANTLNYTETKSIEPKYVRPTDNQNESFNNLGPSYKAEPEAQLISSDGQEIGAPSLQLFGLLTEQSACFKDDSSTGLQNQGSGGPESHREHTMTVEVLDLQSSPCFSQVDQSTQEISRDEPDHYKLEFFPMTLKAIGVVSEDLNKLGSNSKAHDLLSESTDTKCITGQESTQLCLQESVKESVQQEGNLGDIHPVIGLDQDIMTPGSGTATSTATAFENIKFIRRQRSNTDPCVIQDQKENLQDSSNTESSSRGRLRSVTPPCDKFTSSYTPSPKTLEQSSASVFYPMPDENKSSHKAKNTTPAKGYTFYPTQIFNPMLLLGHAQQSGFYQERTIQQGNMENTNQRHIQSPPHDDQVLLHTQNPESISVQPKSSLKSTEGPSNTKPMPSHSVAPVWLPPQPARYIGSSDKVNEIRSLKTTENPLVRRATIRHKKSNVGVKPTAKRFSNPSLPAIPQKDYSSGPVTSNLPKIQSINVNKIQLSSKNRHLPNQQRISEEAGQSRSSSSMETVREEGHQGHSTVKEKPSNSPESVLLRGSRGKIKPPSSDSSHSIHRRYSTFINSSNLLYQEYSDVALNQEIQRQKPGDSPAEDSQPSSPRVRRRILSSQDSYLQRLSISSADSLWQDIPKIRDSVAFLSMTREEQKLQEAKFELIMSEALYLRSLNIAVDHFQRSTELQEVLSAQDRQWLFSRLSEVRDASADFLFDLEEEFESNMYNFQVCDVVINHVPTFRRVYLPYVTNQSYQDRTFQTLMNGNPRFQQVLAKLESDPVCQRLSLKSFLILPFQRITRLRLLLQNILKRSAPGSTEELQATEAHNALEKLIRDCNESVQRMKDTEELILLNQKIQFECKIFPLISQSRRLVKHGEVTFLEYNSMSFKWKVTTRPVYLHLFNDCLLLSRVREGGRFVVFDHSSEFRVERCEIKLHTNQKNIFRIFLRDSAAMGRESSHDVRETEYIFRTDTQSQKLRWICALSPPQEEIDFLRNHGLSQMQCLKSYKARENDELSLEKADILMITQNSDDGWLHGIRLSDQQSGWFPQCNVQPISRNACLRNLQEEQRLQTARAKLQPTGAKGQ